jgi:hypothetical protein
MNHLKYFIQNQDQFGMLVSFEEFYFANPKVVLLVNENGLNYIYYESKKYGFKTIFLIETNNDQLQRFRNSNIKFNDVFTGKIYRLNIYKTHVEPEETDDKVNDIDFWSRDFYLTTYDNLIESKKLKKKSKIMYIWIYTALISILFASLSMMVPIKWLAYTLSALFILIAFAILYYCFYTFMFRKNDEN